MNKQTKLHVQRYGWHLDHIASHTYVKRTEHQWVCKRRVTDSSNYRVGGISGVTAAKLVVEGLVKIDGRIMCVTNKGRHIVNVTRKIAAAKKHEQYLNQRRGAH